MGVLNATTVQKLQDFTELPEVKGKHPLKLQMYIDRAEAILSAMGAYDMGIAGCVENMELAVNILAENLVILRTPDYMRSQLAGFRSETIGSYSYTRHSSGGIQDPFFGVTDEILLYLSACQAAGSGKIRSSTTRVFVPRTFSLPAFPDEKFYVPEDMRIEEGTVVIDPSDPRIR